MIALDLLADKIVITGRREQWGLRSALHGVTTQASYELSLSLSLSLFLCAFIVAFDCQQSAVACG